MAVLREFYARQQQLPTPPSAASAMSVANATGREAEAATSRLAVEVANSTSAAGLSSAFRGWETRLQRLSARGDAVARQLNLPACLSSAT